MSQEDKIRFRCPQCNKAISVDAQHAGKRGKCPGCAAPVHVPAREPEPAPGQPHDEILYHMEQHYGTVQELALQEIVPALGVTIHVIPASRNRNHVTLFTAGLSDRPMKVPPGEEEYQYAELLMHLPADWPMNARPVAGSNDFWPFDWLRRIAAYPHLNETWLGGPHAIIATDDPPQPLAPNTKLSCLMLFREPDERGKVQLRDGRSLVLYLVAPLYTEERDLELQAGMAELLQRLDRHGIASIVDVNRANVATAASAAWTVGQRVLAQWSPEEYYYPGVIRAIQGGKHLVAFDDGDQALVTAKQIASLEIKVGSRVFGRWKGAPAYFPGKVTRQNGEKIYIQYDDGDQEWTTVSMVRVKR